MCCACIQPSDWLTRDRVLGRVTLKMCSGAKDTADSKTRHLSTGQLKKRSVSLFSDGSNLIKVNQTSNAAMHAFPTHFWVRAVPSTCV